MSDHVPSKEQVSDERLEELAADFERSFRFHKTDFEAEAAACLRELQRRRAAHEPCSAPVAWVPIHPTTGPLWANTIASKDSDHPRSYPLMPLYATQPPKESRLTPEKAARLTALCSEVSSNGKGFTALLWCNAIGEKVWGDGPTELAAALAAHAKADALNGVSEDT